MRRPRPQAESDATLRFVGDARRARHYEIEKAGITPGFFFDVSNCRAASSLSVATPSGLTISVSATTTAATAAEATASTWTRSTFLGLVHLDGSAVELIAVHFLHGSTPLSVIIEAHEAEAARPARFTIHDDLGFRHLSKTLERLTESIVRRRPSQTTHEKFLSHSHTSSNCRRFPDGATQ